MNELLGYIFKNMNNTELAVKNVYKVINNHGKAIRWTSLCVCGICLHMTAKNLEDMKRDKQIAELKKEIEELKQKGE